MKEVLKKKTVQIEKDVTVYEASDGKTYEKKEEAEEHESLTLKQIKDVVNKWEKRHTKKIEEECHSWGCCSPHYREVIQSSPGELYHVFEEYYKN